MIFSVVPILGNLYIGKPPKSLSKLNTKKNKKPTGIGWPQVVRDVLVASMNKGQFPLAIVSLIVLALIAKMPAEDVTKLVFLIIDELKAWYLFGYVLAAVFGAGWFFHAKWQRRLFTDEVERISLERTKVQELQLGNKIKSSERVV